MLNDLRQQHNDFCVVQGCQGHGRPRQQEVARQDGHLRAPSTAADLTQPTGHQLRWFITWQPIMLWSALSSLSCCTVDVQEHHTITTAATPSTLVGREG